MINIKEDVGEEAIQILKRVVRRLESKNENEFSDTSSDRDGKTD
jgi:hypothetical protein